MITCLVGGQYGSEGKGLIAGHIGLAHKHHVRVGGANAGHTLYTFDGDEFTGPKHDKHVVRQIPCGAYANPSAKLYLGPGALISAQVLHDELMAVATWRLNRGFKPPWLHVDPRAHIITDQQIQAEAASGLKERIGSTSATAREGVGAAQAARVMRDLGCVTAKEFFTGPGAPTWPVRIGDVPSMLAQAPKNDSNRILAEGTQGYDLSLTTGDFPYVTSRNTTAAGLLADCGLAPKRLDRVIVVFRTYPIRVAGNSGPFRDDSEEIDWSTIGVDPENERTTVTKKVRRVATFSYRQAWEACKVNGATEIALTFADYIDPEILRGAGLWDYNRGATLRGFPKVQRMVDQLEYETEVPVTMLGTGPTTVIDLRR